MGLERRGGAYWGRIEVENMSEVHSTYPVAVRWEGEKRGLGSSPDGLPDLKVSSPPPFGGPAGVWSPEHLFVLSPDTGSEQGDGRTQTGRCATVDRNGPDVEDLVRVLFGDIDDPRAVGADLEAVDLAAGCPRPV